MCPPNYQSSRKNCFVILELIVDKMLLFIVNKHQCNCLLCVVSWIIYLLLLVIIIQYIVKIGLVIEMFIPNYQSLFFKLTQLAQLSEKNLGKPQINFYISSVVWHRVST